MTDTTIWSDEYEDDPKWGRRRLTREEAWQRKEILRGIKENAREAGYVALGATTRVERRAIDRALRKSRRRLRVGKRP